MLNLRPERGGFSIVEAIVALAILVVLGSVMIPAVTRKIGSSQSANLVQDIRSLNVGIQQFRENVGRYPAELGQLSAIPSVPTQRDVCQLPIPAPNLTQWRGPYISQNISEIGSIPSGDATIQLSLGRIPATTSSSTDMIGVLTITALNVDQLVADETDLAFDGINDLGGPFVTGSVRWNVNIGQPNTFGRTGTLTMRIPIRGCSLEGVKMVTGKKSLRRAFSLAEILVAIAIIAVMSAVMIPGLGSHITRSDAARIASDLTVIQEAVQAFVSDVHRYPAQMSELTTKLAFGDKDLDNENIPTHLIARWKGPYLAKESVLSGLGHVAVSSTFSKVNGTNAISYIAVTLTGVQASDYSNLEEMIDAGTPTVSSSTSGVLQYNSISKVLTYLALPIL